MTRLQADLKRQYSTPPKNQLHFYHLSRFYYMIKKPIDYLCGAALHMVTQILLQVKQHHIVWDNLIHSHKQSAIFWLTLPFKKTLRCFSLIGIRSGLLLKQTCSSQAFSPIGKCSCQPCPTYLSEAELCYILIWHKEIKKHWFRWCLTHFWITRLIDHNIQ